MNGTRASSRQCSRIPATNRSAACGSSAAILKAIRLRSRSQRRNSKPFRSTRLACCNGLDVSAKAGVYVLGLGKASGIRIGNALSDAGAQSLNVRLIDLVVVPIPWPEQLLDGLALGREGARLDRVPQALHQVCRQINNQALGRAHRKPSCLQITSQSLSLSKISYFRIERTGSGSRQNGLIGK